MYTIQCPECGQRITITPDCQIGDKEQHLYMTEAALKQQGAETWTSI